MTALSGSWDAINFFKDGLTFLIPGSSPGGPTISLGIHQLMALRSGDWNPLVHPLVGCPDRDPRVARSLSLKLASFGYTGEVSWQKNVNAVFF